MVEVETVGGEGIDGQGGGYKERFVERRALRRRSGGGSGGGRGGYGSRSVRSCVAEGSTCRECPSHRGKREVEACKHLKTIVDQPLHLTY